MKTLEKTAASRSIGTMLTRFVAVSATMPNIQDVGRFLECTKEGVFFFDDS